MTIISPIPGITPIIQNNMLYRVFHEALFNETLWRMTVSRRMEWRAHEGETIVKTRRGLLPVITTPTKAGQDPGMSNNAVEQWVLTAENFSHSSPTQLPISRAALASTVVEDGKDLAIQAGRSLNRVCRNRLVKAYVGGRTFADAAGSSSTSLVVGSLNGFTQQVDSDGNLRDVSSTNKKNIKIGGTVDAVVVSTAPDSSLRPDGRGTLTLEVAKTWSQNDPVVAEDAAHQVNSGGGSNTDALASTSELSFEDIRKAVAHLKENGVPPTDDGFYHWHGTPSEVSSLFGDNEMQRSGEGRYDADPWVKFEVGRRYQVRFYSNAESPTVNNTGLLSTERSSGASSSSWSPDIGADVRNRDGTAISRSVVYGGGALYEHYIPEREYVTDAGVQGRVGEFTVVGNGLEVNVEGIRYILRAPQDVKQEIITQAWSWSGDWGVPSDVLGGVTKARFKRSVVINSGSQS